MARIKVEFPQKIIYCTELTVRGSDLNYGGHVGNDTVLTLAQEARILFYNTLGFKDEVSFEGDVGQIITDAAVQYKSEAFLGNVIVIAIGISDFSKYGFDLYYRLSHKNTDMEIAVVKTGIVCFDYSTRKVAVVPKILLERIQGLL